MPLATQIRRALDGDSELILRCLAKAFAPFRTQYTEGAWDNTILDLERILRRMAEMIVFVAVNGKGDVIGTVGYRIEENSHAHIRGMAVLPTAQGCGIAKLLLDQVETDLRGAGCHILTLDTTRPLERAIQFYEKNGFNATGEGKEFYGMELLSYAKELPAALTGER